MRFPTDACPPQGLSRATRHVCLTCTAPAHVGTSYLLPLLPDGDGVSLPSRGAHATYATLPTSASSLTEEATIAVGRRHPGAGREPLQQLAREEHERDPDQGGGGGGGSEEVRRGFQARGLRPWFRWTGSDPAPRPAPE